MAAYRLTGVIVSGCEAASVNRRVVYDWRERDPQFAADMDLAGKEALDLMEQEAHRRAARGFEKGVYHKGIKVDTEMQYSDNLMMFLMKSRDPQRFRDNQSIELSGPGGGPIQHQDLSHLTDEQLAQIRAASALLEGPKKDA